MELQSQLRAVREQLKDSLRQGAIAAAKAQADEGGNRALISNSSGADGNDAVASSIASAAAGGGELSVSGQRGGGRGGGRFGRGGGRTSGRMVVASRGFGPGGRGGAGSTGSMRALAFNSSARSWVRPEDSSSETATTATAAVATSVSSTAASDATFIDSMVKGFLQDSADNLQQLPAQHEAAPGDGYRETVDDH